MNSKLKKILFDIYWETDRGWRRDPKFPSEENFKILVDAGIASYPEELNHDQVLERYWALIERIDPKTLVSRFIASLSKNKLEYRADLMAFLELPISIERHSYSGKGFCELCGIPQNHTYDYTKNQFKRYKFGAGNMYFLMDNVITLETTLNEPTIVPNKEDIGILNCIIRIIRDLPVGVGAQELKEKLKGVFKGNDDNRRSIIEAFGVMDILSPSDTSQEAYLKVPARSNWFGPVSVWTSSDGINEQNLNYWFGEYLS